MAKIKIEHMGVCSPLVLEIILHYYCCPKDFPRMDENIPSIVDAVDYLERNEIIRTVPKTNTKTTYKITEKGKAFVDELCQTPFPTLKREWVVVREDEVS